MKKYMYQPHKRHESYLESVQILKSKGYPVTTEVPVHGGLEELRKRMVALGFQINTLTIDVADYQDYVKRAEYLSRYPRYYPDRLLEKSIEHYVGWPK